MKLEYDKQADAIYIHLKEAPYAYGKDLDDERRVDFAADNTPIGVELLCVSQGVMLDDLPEVEAVSRLLAKHHIKAFA